ncbi:MAG: hypothetical protein ACRELY_16805 [Polyangiaceae bacterium]
MSNRCVASGALRGVARLQSAPYPYTLAISIPETGIYAPATTLVLPSIGLVVGGPTVPPRNAPCTGDSPTATCISVTTLGSSGGVYETNPDQANNEAHRHINDGDVETSLPVHTTFTLLTSDATTATTLSSLGIPVMPTYALVTDQTTFVAPPIGPGNTAPIGWTSPLQVGRYRRDIVVDVPFNDSFPPWSDIITVPPSPFGGVDLQTKPSNGTPDFTAPIDPQPNRTINVTSVPDGVSLQGWTASIVTNDDEERLTSSIVTIASPLGGSVTMNTVTPPTFPVPAGGTKGDLTSRLLVIAPPPGVVFPSIAYIPLGGSILDQQYPAVPKPALVQGTITRAGDNEGGAAGAPVAATLDFVSVDGTLAQGGLNVPLRYRTSAQAGSDGNYSVNLPRGDYYVAVEPDPSSGLGLMFATNLDDAGIDGTLHVLENTTGLSDHDVQSGHFFPVGARTVVTGRVTITDGRPLGGVMVFARPAIGQLAPGVPPKLASLARSAFATADATGVYSLGLDPGVYDLFAESPFSSGFAWGVAPAHAIVPAGLSNPPVRVDISVPAPIDASMRLYDPNADPVRGALVQAFVALNPADPNSPQIQIGEGRTDSDGALDLLLPPQIPQ